MKFVLNYNAITFNVWGHAEMFIKFQTNQHASFLSKRTARGKEDCGAGGDVKAVTQVGLFSAIHPAYMCQTVLRKQTREYS